MHNEGTFGNAKNNLRSLHNIYLQNGRYIDIAFLEKIGFQKAKQFYSDSFYLPQRENVKNLHKTICNKLVQRCSAADVFRLRYATIAQTNV